MKKSLIIGISIAIVAALLMSSVSMAQKQSGQQYGPGKGSRIVSEDCPVVSGLTEEQQQALYRKVREHREWMYPQKQLMIARQSELNSLLATKEPDQARIKQVKDELINLNREIFERKINHKIEMSSEFGFKTRMQSHAGTGKRAPESVRPGRKGSQRNTR